VSLEVRLLESNRRLGRDLAANRGADWSAQHGNGYVLRGIRAVRFARGEGRFYALTSLPRWRPLAVLLGGWESPAYWQLLVLAKLTGVRTVGFYESTLQTQRHSRGFIGLMRRFYFASLDAVVVPGPAARAAVMALGIDPLKVIVGFNAVDGSSVAEAARSHRLSLRGRKSAGHQYVYIGQLIERKGVDLVIDAFASAREEGDTLAIYGKGPLEDELRHRCRHHGVEHAVSFKGYVPNKAIPNALAESHTLVLPSRQEVWGLVVNEALAAGIQAVVSDVAGVAASVAGMEGVFLAQPEVTSVADQMRSAREQWDGPIEAPEILKHGPAEFASIFMSALVPGHRSKLS
jgi:glycosyltransferase involved in cell wall biosynthesis